MEIVDTHAHIIAPDSERYPFAPIGGKLSGWAVARPVDAEEMLRLMDGAGVEKTVLVQASTAYGYDCRYVADTMAQYPDRFRGVRCIDPFATDAVVSINHWICDRKMGGLRLFTVGTTMTEQAPWIDDPAIDPVWGEAARLGIPVCLQMRLEAHEALSTVLKRHPGVRILLDHMAYPEVEDGPPFDRARPLFALAQHPNLYLKLTHRTLEELAAHPHVRKPFLDKLVATFGANRITWGSNCPAAESSLEDLVALARESLGELDPADQAMIFSGTAKSLYS